MVRDDLKKYLQSAISLLGFDVKELALEHPAMADHGDYSVNIALRIAAEKKQKPREIAAKIVERLKKDNELKKIVEKIDIAGPGFINFWLSKEYLQQALSHLLSQTYSFPQFHLGSHKKMMFEFAHFNTHKAVHIGHIRNITLGESLSRLMGVVGNKVVRVSYGGDVGLHIAKCLYGIKYQRVNVSENQLSLKEKTALLAQAYTAGNNAYEDDERAKKEIIEINKKIYAKDPEIMKLWEETKQWSLEQFDQLYKRVNTKFDRLYYESEVFERGLEISQEALKKGILEKSEGAIVFNGKQYGIDTRVFITAEGNPTYEGKELGIAEREFSEHGSLDRVVHLVAPEQTSFFQVTFKVQELLNPTLYAGKQEHFSYGYVRLAEGKMSSRKGTIIKGEWLLDEVKKKIKEAFSVDDEKAEAISVAAVKYSLLKVDAKAEIAFDINQSIALDGNSGPYLLYTYARSRSVVEKAGKFSYELRVQSYELKNEELSLLRTLVKFPEIIGMAAKNYSPHVVCTYLFDLAQKFNLFYQKVPILQSPEEEKKFRLVLTKATGEVLKKGLDLLGIQVVEKM